MSEDRLARELAESRNHVKAYHDKWMDAEAKLARAQTALRDIASCRTRPPADAIEIACRYWAEGKG